MRQRDALIDEIQNVKQRDEEEVERLCSKHVTQLHDLEESLKIKTDAAMQQGR